MIFGIGTDIVQVARIKRNLDKYGERFAHKILADEELALYKNAANKAHFVAKRFAAKEAMSKALGTGFRDGLQLQHIVVSHDELGKPLIKCREKAEKLTHQFGVNSMHLTLSDEQEYAVAFVVLEQQTTQI